MKNLFRSAFLAVAAVLAAGSLAAQSVQLVNGQTLLATIENADGDGLRIKRLDNGGVLDLRWEHLSTASALDIKRRFDLAGDAESELLVNCEEVTYTVAGQPNRLIGKVADRTPTHLVVVQRGVTFNIPTAELRGMRTVQAPVTQVYTLDEFYASRLAEDPPGDSADKHLLVVEDLLKVRDYERAEEHAKRAKELGNSRDPQRVDMLAAKVARYKEASRERALLDQIQACRSRGQLADFAKGRKLLEQFAKDFPQSKIKSDFDAEQKRFEASRTRFMTQQVAEQFRRSLQIVAEKKAAETELTLQAARDYAENELTDELFARTAQQLGIDVAEAKTLWPERVKFPVGKRAEHFAYGLGSWILGEPAIVKDTAVGKAKDQQAQQNPGDQGNQRDVERVQRALRQAVERRRAAQAAGQGQQQQEESDEDWWREASRPERAGWLRAYYAEFGKQLVVTFASASACAACYGQGTQPEMGPDGKPIRAKCYLCHGTKWTRSFKAY
jgi:hypothetical protein